MEKIPYANVDEILTLQTKYLNKVAAKHYRELMHSFFTRNLSKSNVMMMYTIASKHDLQILAKCAKQNRKKDQFK